ncbi:GNAT family N-acetyltransferase [Mucilaginibacter sp. UYCu711]|uniref:GNAT family N-acetyltransferase n=1 Tax=Mucilaginibacter sp. UYCu711 TaxID=3156339 RepID=UPI003D1CD442
MEHVLDNPAYNALNTGNANLANGTDRVKYFDSEVSPFIGFDDNFPANFEKLYELIPYERPVGFVSPIEAEIPKQWQVIYQVPCFQMVHSGDPNHVDESNLIVLTDRHIPQMVALTKLTNPGPFSERTIDFGHYRGIFDGDKLVAMAGQRMNPLPYAEVSAVCTHPDYAGKGYAKQLLQWQVNRIIAEGNTPFLHVKCDNERPIKIYEQMGFAIRCKMYFYILKKNS